MRGVGGGEEGGLRSHFHVKPNFCVEVRVRVRVGVLNKISFIHTILTKPKATTSKTTRKISYLKGVSNKTGICFLSNFLAS